MIYYQTIKISPCNPGFSLAWVEILIWDADLFVSGVWIEFIDPWYSVLLVSGVWMESIDPWYFHVFGSSLSTPDILFCLYLVLGSSLSTRYVCIWCLDRVCRPFCWFVSNKPSSVPNNSIQYCWMPFVIEEITVIQITHLWAANFQTFESQNLQLVTRSMATKQNRTRLRGLQELPKTPCVLAAKLTETTVRA